MIIFAIGGMIDIRYFQRLWRISRSGFLLAILAFLGVLTFGVLPGVAIGVVFALVILVDHIGRPVGIILGRTPDGQWADVDDDGEPVAGFLVYRQESPIVFVNARRVTDRIRELATDDVRVVVVDVTAIASVDSTGFDALRVLRDELAVKGIEVWTINPSGRKTALMDEEAAVLDVTIPRRFQTYDDALGAYQALDPPTQPG